MKKESGESVTELKKAVSWHEPIWFVKCPYCDYCQQSEYGGWDDGETIECSGGGPNSCHKEFIVTAEN